MYNTYIASTVLSLRTKGSVSFSFNDCSNLINERFVRNPSCSGCCCCSSSSCCASSSSFSTQRVPVKPCLFYGLRQSNLIQWPPCRRLILNGRDRYYCRIPAYVLNHGCFEVSCSFKEKGGSEIIERGRNGRSGCVNLSERRCLSSFENVEAVLSLLSEEESEEYLGNTDRKQSLSKRVEIDKRRNYGGESQRERKKNVELQLLESDPKIEYESVQVDLSREECQRKRESEKREVMEEIEERKDISRGQDRRGRKASTSFSLCYSLSSIEDFEGDKEAWDDCGDFSGQSSSGYKNELFKEDRFERQVVEELKRHKDGIEQEEVVLDHRTSATRTSVDWDLRKKSEKKKLTETDEIQSRKQSSQMHSRTERSHASDYMMTSSSHRHIDRAAEDSNLAVNLERATRKQCNQMDSQVLGQSELRRKNHQQIADIQETDGRYAKTSSQHHEKFSGGGKNLTVDVGFDYERKDKRTGKLVERDTSRRNTQQLIDISGIQRQSESRRKFEEEGISLNSVQETNEQYGQIGKRLTGEFESRQNSHQFSEMSETHESRVNLQSQSKIMSEKESVNIVSHSGAEAKVQSLGTDQKVPQGTDSRRGSQNVTNISVNITDVSTVQAHNAETVINTQRTSPKGMIDQGSESTPVEATSYRDNQTDDNVTLAKSRHDACRATKASIFHERASQEASNSQASLIMVSQGRVQQIDVGEREQRSSQTMLIPPSTQLVATSSLCVELDGGLLIEGSRESSESNSSALYTSSGGRTTSRQEAYVRDRTGKIDEKPLNLLMPEDALDSAQRLAESSMHFVGDFVEKARHELSTSETKMVQSSCEDLQLKECDSRRSSGVSGVKRPSDKMWDVTVAHEPVETEAPENGIATENIIVRRTGKTLWNIIGDMVRLCWGSHSETPKPTGRTETPTSAGKIGAKSSSRDSVTSEAWFSGHELYKNSDENVQRKIISTPKEATSSHQFLLRQTSGQSQREASDTVGSTDEVRQLEVGAPSPSNVLQSGSTSKGLSIPSEEENLTWSQVVSSGLEGGPSSSAPLPHSHMTGSILEQSSGTHKVDVSGIGPLELIEKPVSTNLTELTGSEWKDVELKQRKLQWLKQIPRDRFVEWDEAYSLETEQRKIDEMFMREALVEAKKAADYWEVPVGAALVQHGKVIARGYNLVEELRDSTAHAEMICIREASKELHSWRLAETTLYVTLEPCPMCAGAILQARIDTVVWGAPNKLLGADGSWIRLFPNGGGGNGLELSDKPAAPVHPFHAKITVRRGILATECADVMQQFFKLRRKKKDKSSPQPSSLPIANPQSKVLDKMQNIFHFMFGL